MGRGAVHPVTTMDRPVQVTIDADQRRRARRRAAEQGLTLSAYVATLIEADLETWVPDAERPAGIPVDDGTGADLPDHDGMNIGEAVAARMKKTDASR